MAGLISKIVEKLASTKNFKKMFGDKATFEKMIENLREEHSHPFEMNYSKFSVSVTENVISGMKYFVLKPDKTDTNNRVMFIHGGAYVLQITPEHWKFLDTVVQKSGAEMWVPVYPLAPNFTFDDAFNPVKDLYEKFCAETEGKTILMGDSAGAGFCLALTQYANENNIITPDELILISPWLDVEMTDPLIEEINHFDITLDTYGLRICGKMWAGERDTRDPMISPLYGNFDIPCSVTVFSGTHDIINADTRAFINAAKKNNTKTELFLEDGLQHNYVLWPIPEAKKAVRMMCSVIRRESHN